MNKFRKFFRGLGFLALGLSLSPAGHAATTSCPFAIGIAAIISIDQMICKNLPQGPLKLACHIGTGSAGAAIFGYGGYRIIRAQGGGAVTHPITEQNLDDEADVEADVDID
jgi:hypothetical protein